MSTALVLGGGGPLGIAWEAGLLTGLARRGGLARPDRVVGTSAGSVVGATLAAGLDLTALPEKTSRPLTLAPNASADIEPLMTLAAEEAGPAEKLARIGEYALAAETVTESGYLGLPLFAAFAGVPWPDTFRCTALDISTRRLRVWDANTGPGLATALAASCAVPGLFPPVTVNGAKHIDGGVLSPLNAALGAGHDHVVVVSCFTLTGPGAAEIDQLRPGGSQVTLIEPSQDFLILSDFGTGVMNTAHVPDAYQAGLRQSGTMPAQLPPA
ncbi:patatin-like phospholipase family protein [Amycolatopsis pigmentata]|uniref:Patatin-like phospholipase family protein n=1 Tax=Amycolatopsis pigmentata TaxID=450801 RepID=A0ABW5FXP4_9PSEU